MASSFLTSMHSSPFHLTSYPNCCECIAEELLAAKVLGNGAEGKVYLAKINDMDVIIKERIAKRYRVPELDAKLTKQRLLQEARCMTKTSKAGVAIPTLYHVDKTNFLLYMEYIVGVTVKAFLKSAPDISKVDAKLAENIGKAVATMHDADVVHGDLTTSNMMLHGPNSSLVILDFGLGNTSPSVEDKAVDLYVLERAFVSTHPNTDYIVCAILESYRNTCRRASEVLDKFEQVRQRGRKRDMTG